jgi:hypothetical protein
MKYQTPTEEACEAGHTRPGVGLEVIKLLALIRHGVLKRAKSSQRKDGRFCGKVYGKWSLECGLFHRFLFWLLGICF